MTTDSHSKKKTPAARTPLLLRIVSIVIIVEGCLGLLFFVLAGIFQLNDANFTAGISENGFSSNFYSFYIILHVFLYSGLGVSGFLMLSLRRIGFYLFIFNYLIMTAFSIYLNDLFAWTAVISGFIFLTLLIFSYKKLA
ncbi:MAG: hypothetical protein L3J31_04330 [Bacteroidales bacterium]|nr:hypothetical protein [Bacteroidales bacterium]MCF6342012.1 hypothetical protein [Bacteroidales bacterium]